MGVAKREKMYILKDTAQQIDKLRREIRQASVGHASSNLSKISPLSASWLLYYGLFSPPVIIS